MPDLRFPTAHALFDAFPEASQKVGSPAPTNQSPIAFLKALSSANKLPEAVTFCAYLLPRREAVWWACRCVRTLWGDIQSAPDEAAGLLAAEAWVYEPDDKHREAALDVGTKGETKNPMIWLALAAGWSGGFDGSNPTKQVPVPQYMTARAARIAVLTSVPKVPGPARSARLQECIQDGIKLAENGL
jgi:hypothetical protein